MTEPAVIADRERRARLANMRQELLAPVIGLVGYGEFLTEEADRLEPGQLAPDLRRILSAAWNCSSWSTACSTTRPPPISRRAPISKRSRSGCGTICATP